MGISKRVLLAAEHDCGSTAVFHYTEWPKKVSPYKVINESSLCVT